MTQKDRPTLLDQLHHRILDDTMDLPAARITVRERRRQGGLTGPTTPALVSRVASGLVPRPALFPDCAHRAPGLLRLQQDADGWLALRRLFLDLADQCHDGYLEAQGQAAQEAGDILDLIIAGAARPDLAPHLDHGLRLRLLLPALLLRHQALQHGVDQRAQKRPRAAAAEPPSPARQARARQRKQERMTEWRALFDHVIARYRE